jgi:CheY-like chemotaxis protein
MGDAPLDAGRQRGGRAIHLLFVDDDPLAEMTLRRAYRRLEMDGPLTIAHDGLEALELLRDPFFPLDRCVVLLDLNMPRMDGVELLKELGADPELALLPVVVMTTSDDQRDLAAAYEAGASGYFVKPVSFADFVEQVRSVIEYWSRAVLPPPKGRSGLLPPL